MKRATRIVFALLLMLVPTLFVWHTELSTTFKFNLYLTNGFGNYNAVQVYHVLMYFMFAVNVGAAICLLWSDDDET